MVLTTALMFTIMLEMAKLGHFEPLTKEELPIVTEMSPRDMGNKICGDNWDPKLHCDRFKALFFPETNEMMYSSELNLDTELGKSIIGHEMVHALQTKKHPNPDRTCEQIIDLEKEAYTLQDYYMVIHGHYDTHQRNIVNHIKCVETKVM